MYNATTTLFKSLKYLFDIQGVGAIDIHNCAMNSRYIYNGNPTCHIVIEFNICGLDNNGYRIDIYKTGEDDIDVQFVKYGNGEFPEDKELYSKRIFPVGDSKNKLGGLHNLTYLQNYVCFEISKELLYQCYEFDKYCKQNPNELVSESDAYEDYLTREIAFGIMEKSKLPKAVELSCLYFNNLDIQTIIEVIECQDEYYFDI